MVSIEDEPGGREPAGVCAGRRAGRRRVFPVGSPPVDVMPSRRHAVFTRVFPCVPVLAVTELPCLAFWHCCTDDVDVGVLCVMTSCMYVLCCSAIASVYPPSAICCSQLPVRTLSLSISKTVRPILLASSQPTDTGILPPLLHVATKKDSPVGLESSTGTYSSTILQRWRTGMLQRGDGGGRVYVALLLLALPA